MLYDAGNECADVTGGWTSYNVRNTSVGQKKTDSMSFNTNGNSSSGGFMTAKVTEASICKNIYIKSIGTDPVHGTWGKYFGFKDSVGNNNSGHGIFPAYATVATTLISDFNSLARAYVEYDCYGGTQKYEITHVWMDKADDWYTWLRLAKLTSAVSSLDEILANEELMEKILASINATDYMLACSGDIMFGVLGSDIAWGAMTPAAKAKMYNTPYWRKFANIYGRLLV